MAKKYYYQLPWIIWLLIILVLSLTPGDKIPEIEFTLFELDKVIHFIIYFILALFMCFGLYSINNEPFLKRVVLVIVTGIIIGVLIEVFQETLVTNRQFDNFDIIANGCGTLVGFIFIEKYHKNKLKLW